MFPVVCFFFFQAEDGIRDRTVTGVQTCALPIYPATAVRKAQKLVEKDGVKFLTGVVLSSEALAVSAKCPEWKVIFMSTINGAGALTAKSWNRYFFRVNTSGPMGARAVSLYLVESPMKRFFGLGSDYAWGRDSVGSFEKLITAAGKEIVGKDYPQVGTKDV